MSTIVNGYFVRVTDDYLTTSGRINQYATYADMMAETDERVVFGAVADASSDPSIGSSAAGTVFYEKINGVWTHLYQTPETDDIVIVDETNTTASIALEGKHHYRFTQPLTSLEITSLLDPNSVKEAVVMFTTGSTFQLTLPDSAKFFGARPTFNINTSYVLSYRFGAFSVSVLA